MAVSPPVLAITTKATQAVIAWPDTARGFVLETNADVTNAGGWQAFAGKVDDTNGQQTADVNTSNRTEFSACDMHSSYAFKPCCRRGYW